MPEQLDSAVLDSPEALSPKSMSKGGASIAPVQQVKSPSPVAAPPPPPPMETPQQSHIASQPPLPCSGQPPPTPILPPLPTRIYDENYLKTSFKPLEVKFCRDFQNDYCKRGELCNYIHSTIKDEMHYKDTLKLPIEVIKQNHRIICVEFAEGECKKFTECKMWHIQTSNPLMEIDDKKCIPPLPITNYQYVRPYLPNNNLSESYASANIQHMPITQMNMISNIQKPLSNMYNSSDEQQLYSNNNNNNNNNSVMPSKLWSRPLKFFPNGSTFTNIVTSSMMGNPIDVYGDAPPLPKYPRTNEEHLCCTCKDNEKRYENIEQMMLGTMYKVKEMEQSMSEIAEIIEKTIPSMKTVLDIITRTKSKEIVRPDTGAVICPSLMQTKMGNHQTFQNYTSPYPSSIRSQNHV